MRIIGCLLAATLLLAGCAEDTPKEPKASAKPTATATVPPMPAAALEDTEAGAIAFVKHYIDVFNYASNTGDVKELKKLSDSGCEACTSYRKTIEAAHVGGGEIREFGWTVTDVVAGRETTLDLKIDSKRYLTKERANSAWTEVLAANYEIQAMIAREDNGWTLAELYLPGEESD